MKCELPNCPNCKKGNKMFIKLEKKTKFYRRYILFCRICYLATRDWVIF